VSQPTLLPSPIAGGVGGRDAFHVVSIYASTVISMFEGSTPNDRASPAFASAMVSPHASAARNGVIRGASERLRRQGDRPDRLR
jgi:hypothetical protein